MIIAAIIGFVIWAIIVAIGWSQDGEYIRPGVVMRIEPSKCALLFVVLEGIALSIGYIVSIL